MRQKLPLTLNERKTAATGNKQLEREFESQGRLDALKRSESVGFSRCES